MSDVSRLSFAVTDEPSPADVEIVEAGLVAYNVARSRPYDRRPLNIFIRDERGAAVGGLTGHTNWEWLYVDCLWLPDDLRARGWGTRLLEAAEAEALARGCRRSHLWSYSFQAPEFYQKHGYIVYGVLEGYPPGERRVLLRKEL